MVAEFSPLSILVSLSKGSSSLHPVKTEKVNEHRKMARKIGDGFSMELLMIEQVKGCFLTKDTRLRGFIVADCFRRIVAWIYRFV